MESWLSFLLLLLALLAIAAFIIGIIALTRKNNTGLQQIQSGAVELVPPVNNLVEFKIAPRAGEQTNIVPLTPIGMIFVAPNANVEYSSIIVFSNGVRVETNLKCSNLECIPVPVESPTGTALSFRFSLPLSAFPKFDQHIGIDSIVTIGDSENVGMEIVGWPNTPTIVVLNPMDPTLVDVTVQYDFAAPLPEAVVFTSAFAITVNYRVPQ